jgi:hypothetical protein
MRHGPANPHRDEMVGLLADLDQSVAYLRVALDEHREHAIRHGTLAAHHRYIAARMHLADELRELRFAEREMRSIGGEA